MTPRDSVVDDIDYLFTVLAAADAGDNWEVLRDVRPLVER